VHLKCDITNIISLTELYVHARPFSPSPYQSCRPLAVNSILFSLILSDSSLFSLILSYSILFSLILTDSILFSLILSDSIQFDSLRFYSIQFDSFRFHSIQFDSFRFYSIKFDSFRFDYCVQFSCGLVLLYTILFLLFDCCSILF